ncbi:hypothetical protein AcV5_004266 [Taiwanofungus camphoratus]|nr:hypothetical protein AcV5_004266 [Antrodia cinnamomea]KAI0961230.1 hypothetical protein AcV7_000383 [Antrodia cinnamomea]
MEYIDMPANTSWPILTPAVTSSRSALPSQHRSSGISGSLFSGFHPVDVGNRPLKKHCIYRSLRNIAVDRTCQTLMQLHRYCTLQRHLAPYLLYDSIFQAHYQIISGFVLDQANQRDFELDTHDSGPEIQVRKRLRCVMSRTLNILRDQRAQHAAHSV